MSKTGGTTRTNTSTSYPDFQQPYVGNLLSEAQRLYNTGGPQQYQGSTVAGFNPLETQGQQSVVDATAGLKTNAQNAQGYSNFLLGDGLNPESNPYFQSSLNAAIRPIKDNLLQSILPSIRNQSTLAGTYGGSRQGIAEGLAAQGAINKAGDITSQMSSAEYNNAANRGQQAMSFLPTLNSLLTQPGQVLSGVGETQRGMSQAQLNDLISKWNYDQNLPNTNLSNYANLVSSPFGQQGTSSTVAPQASTASQIAGGALALPSLISIIQGLFH